MTTSQDGFMQQLLTTFAAECRNTSTSSVNLVLALEQRADGDVARAA